MNNPFSPALYIQRYQFVIEVVNKFFPRKVLDLGCADCRLLRKLRFHRHSIEVLVGVDIDCVTIKQGVDSLAPLTSDYLQPSPRPLSIELYQGSITEREPYTRGFDLVTCIEVIEHLELWEVDRFSDVLFGYMLPHAVIVSTPNAEFNPLLPGLRGFRNSDHKFEWTRVEFETWALGVCRKYGYSVELTGVGEAADQNRDVGFCSQIGVFRRDAVGFCSQIGVFRRDADHSNIVNNTLLEPRVYRLLYKIVYPSLCDQNIFRRTLVSEVVYSAESLKQAWLADDEGTQWDVTAHVHGLPSEEVHQAGEEEDVDGGVYRCGGCVYVPLLHVWASRRVRALCEDVHRLRQLLLENTQVQIDVARDAIVLSVEDEEEGEENVEEEDEGEKRESAVRPINTVEEDWEAEA